MRFHLFLLFFLLFVAACSGPDASTCNACDDGNACTIDVCSELTGFQCVYQEKPNCHLGNKICEEDKGENKCTAPDDCGRCAGDVQGTEYLSYSCENENCVEDVDASAVQPITSTNSPTVGGNRIRVISEFNTPYNLKRDTFSFRVRLDSFARSVENVRLTGIEVSGKQGRLTVILGEKRLERVFASTGTELTEDLVLDFTTSALEGEVKSVKAQLTFTYDSVRSNGVKEEKTASTSITYPGVNFIWVAPTADYGCPESCDDGNDGTRDDCGAHTNFFCTHEPVENVCGNLICDAGETRCSCAEDCGVCSGAAGTFMTYGCEDDACLPSLNSEVTKEPVSRFEQRSLSGFKLDTRYTYNEPFETAHDVLRAEFTLAELTSSSNIKITQVQVISGSNELANEVGKGLMNVVGKKTDIVLEIPAQSKAESSQTLTLQIWYEYMQNGQRRTNKFTKSLGRVTLLSKV